MTVARVMPEQKPGRSVQEVGTPTNFLLAVEAKLGRGIGWDLAANKENNVVPKWFGPGSPVGEDAFKTSWHIIPYLLWLNPPYANIGDWAKKCAAESRLGAHIALLIPAAIGTNYFREWIYPFARIYALSPRLTFVGHTQSYPKDLILCEYGSKVIPGFECWRWKS